MDGWIGIREKGEVGGTENEDLEWYSLIHPSVALFASGYLRRLMEPRLPADAALFIILPSRERMESSLGYPIPTHTHTRTHTHPHPLSHQ